MRKRLTAAAAVMALCISLLAGTVAEVSGFTINTGDYRNMSEYPGIFKFDYSTTPVRENIPPEVMVDPEYTFRVTDKTVDEYFGVTGNNTNNGVTRKGFYLKNNSKGKCGVRYNKLFRYQDDWIDVRTTYVDWEANNASKAFVTGGFCLVVWTNVKYVRMRHEFFKAGTDEPVDIKGFFTFTDVDNSQGIGLLPSEVRKLWTNQNGSVLKYKNTVEGYLFIKDMRGTVVAGPGGSNYDPAEAAKVTFSYAFEGSSHDQFILDGKTDSSFNAIGFEASKIIPSGIPDEDTDLVRKQVGSGDGEYEDSNSVRSWDGRWQYCVTALVPMETEEGNLLDGFSITDEVDSCLSIDGVSLLRGAGTDVTDMFEIETEDNVIKATAEGVDTSEFYGYMYYLVIDVSLRAGEEEVREHGHFKDEYTALFKNIATVTYTDGNGEYDRNTNETETEIVYPRKADITITKRIRTDEIHWDHGVPSFIIRLAGTTRQDKEDVEYNRVLTFTPDYVQENGSGQEYVERSVTFSGVEEGSYTCDEYDNHRYSLDAIKDVTGGTVKDGHVIFEINSGKEKKATFVNARKSWNDYSDSQCVVNKFVDKTH